MLFRGIIFGPLISSDLKLLVFEDLQKQYNLFGVEYDEAFFESNRFFIK